MLPSGNYRLPHGSRRGKLDNILCNSKNNDTTANDQLGSVLALVGFGQQADKCLRYRRASAKW